jgi:hypothetical protein
VFCGGGIEYGWVEGIIVFFPKRYHPWTINHTMIVYPLPIDPRESFMGAIKLTPLLRIEARNEGCTPRQRFFLLVAAMEVPAPWTFGGRKR